MGEPQFSRRAIDDNQGLFPYDGTSRQQSNDRARVGLLPTKDEHDTYKRSSARASRRTRAERMSYLMATGHLDPDETRALNPLSADINTNVSHSPIRSQYNENKCFKSEGYRTSNNLGHDEPSTSTKLSRLNQTLVNELSMDETNLNQLHILPPGDMYLKPNSKQGSKKNKNHKLSPYGNQVGSRFGSPYVMDEYDPCDQNQRGKFRQTYTEVSLPMKTSPAFEYILKDNRRRNKRCCMWLIYVSLVTICLIVIGFSGTRLIMRFVDI